MRLNKRGLLLACLSALLVLVVAACQPIQRETFAGEAGDGAAVEAPAVEAPVVEAPADETAAGDGASIAGDWDGVLSIADISLRIMVQLEESGEGWTGTIDIPQQGAADLPLHTITIEAPAVHFEILDGPALGVFDGELTADGAIAGTFLQGGLEGTFSLLPAVAVVAAPIAYTEEEVTFSNGDITLAGTLTLPEGDGPFPALLLVTGSGAQNRNEELAIVFDYQPFREIADRLTQEGIAVLRYDDRGVGKSTGDFASATTSDFAEDAQAGIAYLRARSDIDAAQVGILGHSEGSLVSAKVGASDPDLAFIVSWAGPGVSGYEVVVEQVGAIAAASGADEAMVAEVRTTQAAIMDLVVAGDREALISEMTIILNEQFDQLDAETQAELGDKDTAIAQEVEGQVEALMSDWYREFLAYDPTVDWAQVDVPVLLLFGGLDAQVTVEQNMQPLMDALAAGGNGYVTAEVLPEANHLFQRAVTGSVEEYATLGATVMPEFLDILARWVNENVTFVQ